MREVILPSKAVMKVSPSPFSDAKALLQVALKELKTVPVSKTSDFGAVFKDLFCLGFSSPDIERALWPCLQRCTINYGSGDLKIDNDTFEDIARRDDYMKVCLEVAKENIAPFMKSLYAEWKAGLAMVDAIPQ